MGHICDLSLIPMFVLSVYTYKLFLIYLPTKILSFHYTLQGTAKWAWVPLGPKYMGVKHLVGF